MELYAHTNYADKKVTEGFYFRNPNSRQNIYSLDGGQTLLIGDVLQAQGMGSANCPTVTVTDNVPDQEALARVFADENCFSFQELLPGGFTPRFGGVVTDMSVAGGVRRGAGSGLTWDASASYGSHQSDFFFPEHRQRLARSRHAARLRSGPLPAGGGQPQLRRLVRRHRPGQHRRRGGVA